VNPRFLSFRPNAERGIAEDVAKMGGVSAAARQKRPARETSPSRDVTTRLGGSPAQAGGEVAGPRASQKSSSIAAPSITAPPATTSDWRAAGGPASGSRPRCR
jgi:hypothetical protein